MLGGKRCHYTREVFEAYLQHVLAPSLRAGQVVVMDNLSSHKGTRIKELIESRGCELLYLPPYSSDLNPIERAFFKVKGLCCGVPRRVYPRAPDRGDGPSALGSHGSRHAWVLRPLWLPQDRPAAMTDALNCCYPSSYGASLPPRMAVVDLFLEFQRDWGDPADRRHRRVGTSADRLCGSRGMKKAATVPELASRGGVDGRGAVLVLGELKNSHPPGGQRLPNTCIQWALSV